MTIKTTKESRKAAWKAVESGDVQGVAEHLTFACGYSVAERKYKSLGEKTELLLRIAREEFCDNVLGRCTTCSAGQNEPHAEDCFWDEVRKHLEKQDGKS